MGTLRPQQWRLKWPLTPSQVEALDQMLETLYRTVKSLTINVGQIVGILPIAHGGTGADNAADARVNLGLEIGVDVEAHDPDLDALAALNTTGYMVRTGAAGFATRTFQAGTGISLTNADGVSGNTTISASGTGGTWSVLTNGDNDFPELIFASGDVIMTFIP